MPSLTRAIKYLIYNRSQFLDSCIKNLGFLFPDKIYLSLRYRCIMGKWIDWANPKSFTEKIQWLKLFDYEPEYTQLVDKFAVKEYVSEQIGERYIIKTLTSWNNVSEINIDSLPNKFVLKTTHGGGGLGVVICKDKSEFNVQNAFRQLSESMDCVVGKEFREKPYYDVPRKIIAEELLENEDNDLRDYKFFCFNGKARFFKIDFGRFVEHHANYYTSEGTLLPFGEKGLEPDFNHKEVLPYNLPEMVHIAETLSKGFKFLRVDLYNVAGKIYFGEMTFYPGGGMVPYTPEEWDLKIGEYLKL